LALQIWGQLGTKTGDPGQHVAQFPLALGAKKLVDLIHDTLLLIKLVVAALSNPKKDQYWPSLSFHGLTETQIYTN